jgi:tRNA A-37 threonylcarbamoyl transferase component Bud32
MLEVGALVGEYRIEGLVGQGGMGQVYGAIHPLIGKRAAIKVLRRELCSDPESIERFVLEARAVNQIGHPNIVDIFAFGALSDGRQYMVMEWLRGESLAERLARQPPTLDETCELLLGVCAALDAAHAEHIIHRDLKPHNVFLCEARGMRLTVKLLDFGLVKLMGSDDVRMERTRSGSLLGTPAYMSPEQARGRGVDHRTDLYALGVVAFQLATGGLPFMEPSAMEIIVAHMQQQPPVPSSVRRGLPAVLDALILGLLAKDPADRPTLAHVMGTLTELRAQLARTPQVKMQPPAPNAVVHANADTMATGSALPPARSTAPVRALTSVPAGQMHVETQQLPPPRRARMVALAVFGAIVAGVIAFVVAGRSLRDDDEPQAAAPPVAAPIVAVDASIDAAVALDAPVVVDAAIAIDAAAKPKRGKRTTTLVDAPRKTPPPDAALAPKPDAAPKVDDGDGLLKTGGSR